MEDTKIFQEAGKKHCGKGSKSWIFVRNNYTDVDQQLLRDTECTLMVFGREKGEQGTPHLQGFVTFKETFRFPTLSRNMPGFHLEHAKTQEHAKNYCLKELDYEIFDRRKQGQRSELQAAVADASANVTTKALWRDHTTCMVRYHRGILAAKRALNPTTLYPQYKLTDFPWAPITDWSTSQIIFGPAGIGKTEFAKAHFPKGFLFVTHLDDLTEFDEDSHEGIVFDDLDFMHIPRTAQIHLIDIDNPRSIHIRYATAQIPARTKKIFTTNNPGGAIFSDMFDQAISRRVTVTEVSER